MEDLNYIIANPDCFTQDKSKWTFRRLRQAFEMVPEKFKKEHKLIKMTPQVLKSWFQDNAGNMPGGSPPQEQKISGKRGRKGIEYLNEIIANPECVSQDKSTWTYSRLKQAFEMVPELIKKKHKLKKMSPIILRTWFRDNANNLHGATLHQEQNIEQQQYHPAAPQFGSPEVGGQLYPNSGEGQSDFDGGPFNSLSVTGQFDDNSGGVEGIFNFLGEVEGQHDLDRVGGMDRMISLPPQRVFEIKQRFKEKNLELKQAYLQIQLMQLQIEKLETDLKTIKHNGGLPGVRRNTTALLNL